MSIRFDKETNTLLFFDTKQKEIKEEVSVVLSLLKKSLMRSRNMNYVENKKFDGFKIKLEELVR
ncbi:hypothetical protein MT487_01555 [Lachnospiraceae bacterium NSJ-171]|nr:hypothetical protein [Lachnospiraceae bacterium NSJ-171]